MSHHEPGAASRITRTPKYTPDRLDQRPVKPSKTGYNIGMLALGHPAHRRAVGLECELRSRCRIPRELLELLALDDPGCFPAADRRGAFALAGRTGWDVGIGDDRLDRYARGRAVFPADGRACCTKPHTVTDLCGRTVYFVDDPRGPRNHLRDRPDVARLRARPTGRCPSTGRFVDRYAFETDLRGH